RPPFLLPLWFALFRTPYSKVLGVVDRRFCRSEHCPIPSLRFVVSLNRVLVHPELDARAFLPVLYIAHHFARKISRNRPLRLDLPAQKAHHIRAGKSIHGM